MVKSSKKGSNNPELESGDNAPTSNKNGNEMHTEPDQILEKVNGTQENNAIKPKNASQIKQSVKTQKKRAETAKVKSSKAVLNDKKDKNNIEPLSKTKRPKRGMAEQMESAEETNNKEVSQPETSNSDLASQTKKSVKRKAEVDQGQEGDIESSTESDVRSHKRKATDENREVTDNEENKTVESSSLSNMPDEKVTDTVVKEKESSVEPNKAEVEDLIDQMETEESPETEQENSETVKRKTDEPDSETTVSSRKRQATEKNVKEKDSKTSTKKTVASTRKTRTRKVAVPVPPKSKSNKEVVQKKPSSLKVKAKQEKVLLRIPQLKSVSGKVFVIGENDVGQLGFGEEVEVKKRPAMLELPQTVADIAAGGMHSVCLTQNAEVITFGCNDEGALGRLTSNEKEEATPQKVEISEKVVQISAGDSHTAALTESGQVYLWGNFRSGDGPMGLTADGSKQVKPIKILSKIKIVKISSGTEHLVCLSEGGVIYTCGCGENGQLGRVSERVSRDGGRKGRLILLQPDEVHLKVNSKSVLIDDIWTGSYSTFFKTKETGDIYAFGLNNYNHLGYEGERVCFFPKKVPSFSNKTWLQITGGQHHTLALDDSGTTYSLGRNDYGRLGLGEGCEEKSLPTLIPTLENEKCVSISCGNCVSFALSADGSVYSWGMGTNHQLGHGNDDDCHVPRRIEGNFWTSWRVHKVSGGGQHTLLLACPKTTAKS